jgi:hypothetical protein
MKIFLLESSVYVRPGFPVEFPIDVDGRAIRVAIEWAAIARMMGVTPVDAEQVRQFLHDNRKEIAVAIEAHLYAHGIPRTGELVMAPDDFDNVHAVPPMPVGTASAGRAASAGGLWRAR